MKRDPRLRDLSSDHHAALVLARRLERAQEWSEADGAALAGRFAAELEPHFCVEEECLLPALALGGHGAVVERTRREHRTLRDLVRRAAAGQVAAARELGSLLRAHVRFEERELFPLCERVLSGEALEAAARRCRER